MINVPNDWMGISHAFGDKNLFTYNVDTFGEK